MKGYVMNRALLGLALSLSALVLVVPMRHAFAAESCAVVACNNVDYPFQVVYSGSGQNPVGKCYRTFREALDVFRGFITTGQCGYSTPQACSIVACNNTDNPYRVVYSSTSVNPTDRCYADFDSTLNEFKGLQATGQCQ